MTEPQPRSADALQLTDFSLTLSQYFGVNFTRKPFGIYQSEPLATITTDQFDDVELHFSMFTRAIAKLEFQPFSSENFQLKVNNDGTVVIRFYGNSLEENIGFPINGLTNENVSPYREEIDIFRAALRQLS